MTETTTADFDSPALHEMSRNPSVGYFHAYYRGHQVSNVEVYRVPVDGDGRQVYLTEERDDGATVVRPHDGPIRWELLLDGRFGFDFETREEIERIIPILADGMAVAAGYACHGSNNRLNRHGPTILGAHQDVPDGEVRIG